ncbi:hypothetical protein M422DRAFT_47947 [Sphaerobolus stellatus SS14]|uniref:Uncharacterized protein n=1 Tax=Sphaerobolus stellatus (strain SS14) TaxID=990650 RepID=A0A0C9V8L1_SPHS4|nr:hypothetical protein M422DRAFT_47947 [Sphaerobolus stellatus SS14]
MPFGNTNLKGQRNIQRSARLTGTIGINIGLDLEMRQQNVRTKIAANPQQTIVQKKDLEASRRKLAKLLDNWTSNLSDFMPSDALQEIERPYSLPEEETLRLPSDFEHKDQERLGLKELAEIEYQLRIGVAYDALNKLRNALGLKSFLVRRKRSLASG